MRSRLVALGAVIALLVAAGACSSDDKPSANTNTQETFCGLLLSFRATNESLDGEIASGDPARVETVIKRMVSEVGVLEDRAPADIKSHVDVVGGFVRGFNDLMARHGYDIAAVEANEQAASEFAALNSDAVASSLDQLRAYAEQDCAPSG